MELYIPDSGKPSMPVDAVPFELFETADINLSFFLRMSTSAKSSFYAAFFNTAGDGR